MARSNVEYVVDHAASKQAFQSWSGPVGRHLDRMTKEVGFRSRQEAPRPGKLGTGKTGINYATGKLAATIITKQAHHNGELEGRVITTAKHGYDVHEGTDPHPIKAKQAPKLVFFWHKVGRVVALDKVDHPGTPPNRFMVRALRKVMRNYL